MTDTTEISQTHRLLFNMIEEKGLDLSIYHSKYHVTDKYNELLFIGSFEDCFNWVEAIGEYNILITFLKPIELGHTQPIAKPNYYLRVCLLGIIACIFFTLGILFNPSFGYAGLPAIVTAFYYFHKYKQQNKRQNEN